MINLKIDDKEVQVEEGTTILQAARQVGIDIPTLCFLKDINEIGDCSALYKWTEEEVLLHLVYKK